MRETNPASAPEEYSAQVGTVHPNELLLLADVVAHEGVGALHLLPHSKGASSVRSRSRITLKAATQCLRASAPSDTSLTTGTLLVARYSSCVCDGLTSERQHTLGHLIDLELEVGVQLLELGVELKELLAADVPMEARAFI